VEFGSFMEFHTRPGASQAQAFDESLAHVDMAENLGLDGIWLAESHFSPERSLASSPLIIAAAVAGRTSQIKIGTAVLVLPLGNPLRIAEEAASLDHLSKGRFEFGIGRSGLPGSYEGYNISYAESRERFFEALEVITRAWTNESFSYQGKYYSYHDVSLVPRPFQEPHPPIRIAATSDESFETFGRMGYPIFIGVRGLGVTRVAEQVRSYEKAWAEGGHTGPVDISLRVPVYVAPTKEEAINEPDESFMRQFQRLGRQLTSSTENPGSDSKTERSRRGQGLSEVTWEQALREKLAVGTPEMVVDRLLELRETLHLSGVVAEFNAGELIPRERVSQSLRLFCEEVAPAFR
jgi:alkanesulfonate monooxygenase SsuD/methylene tetrahydromethanopterin reductase-like flavin-dependent oxidoreductase (luciferase family)